MTWMESYDPAAVRRETEKAMSLPLGLASPLWLAFGAVASAGVAWWWMSRLSRPFNIEALAGAAPDAVEPTAPAAVVAKPIGAAFPPPQVVETAPPVEIPPAGEAVADDFTRLAGIGPRIAAALIEKGVTRFAQIAAWSAEDLAAFDKELNLRGRGLRADWVGQAKALAAETP
jgi:predicted flap endonuclease-1-like 5' DNA nuclease